MAGRFQTHTVASEGAELDDNYQKMVADIEEQTQRSGWLFGRGAFDKADLQYLRDFNNSLRYKEVEIEDKERELWERERARVEAESVEAANAQLLAAVQRRGSCGSGGGNGSGHVGAPGLVGGGNAHGSSAKGVPGLASRPAPLLLPVKVKPAGPKHPQVTPQARATSPAAAYAGAPDASSHANKRQKTDCSAATAPSGGQQQLPAGAPATAAGTAGMQGAQPGPITGTTAPRQKSESLAAVGPSNGSSAGGGQQQGQQGQQQVVGRSGSAPAGLGAAAETGGEKAAASGLAKLLGGYGSDDEDEDEDEGGQEEAGRGVQVGPGAGEHAGSGDGRGHAGAGQGAGTTTAGSDRASAQHKAEAGATRVALPPPLGLLSPEELLSDPRVVAEGLLATKPEPQAVQGGDAWDSDEAPSD